MHLHLFDSFVCSLLMELIKDELKDFSLVFSPCEELFIKALIVWSLPSVRSLPE